MKRIFNTVAIIILTANCSMAQSPKTPLPLSGVDQWSSLNYLCKISSDGRFLMFSKDSITRNITTQVLTIQPVDKRWQKSYIGGALGEFSRNNKYVSFKKNDGKIYCLNLITASESDFRIEYFKKTIEEKSINVFKSKLNAQRIIVDFKNKGQRDSIENVLDYVITSKKDGIVFSIEKDDHKQCLYWYAFKNKKINLLFEGAENQQLIFNKVNDISSYVFFKIIEPLPSINNFLAQVDIWSYNDSKDPRPYKVASSDFERSAAINLIDNRIFYLTRDNQNFLDAKGDWALIEENAGNDKNESFWNQEARSSFCLFSLKNQLKKVVLKESGLGAITATFSPDGRYLLFKDDGRLQYFSFDIKSQNLHNLLMGSAVYLKGLSYLNKKFLSPFQYLSDGSIIVRDQYDLWKLDPTGKKPPLNITNGFGKRNHLQFYLSNISTQDTQTKLSKNLSGYILSTFDENTKDWGFYKIANLSGDVPVKLSMGSYFYGDVNSNIIERAESAPVYLISRESVNSAPNLYTTMDFKTFIRQSSINPNSAYNWLSVDLVKWSDDNGKNCTGMLYKPANFDPNKKYPVVVQIYNGFSNGLNHFPLPNESTANYLSIAWLASNGYLVFLPDIENREVGTYLKQTANILLPGVKFISHLPYVNPNKIGLQGASWGGVQVNYVLTQTNLFAAAYSGAGLSEFVSSAYSDEIYNENSFIDYLNLHFGGVLPQVSQFVVDQSALFHVDKISTPLLIRHNKEDDASPFYQSLELFRMLRWLGKKTWLLQYDHEGHGVGSSKISYEDHLTREAQFFDYYLKDLPPPKWMTCGVKAEMKQRDSGLELDTSGARP